MGSPKPSAFVITGPKHNLLSFIEDLVLLGYTKIQLRDNPNVISIISNYQLIEDLTLNGYKEVLLSEKQTGNPDHVSFQLPSDYSSAYEFCKKQLKIAESFFYNKNSFKKGDWIVFEKTGVAYLGKSFTKGGVYRLREDFTDYYFKVVEDDNDRKNGYNGDVVKDFKLRRATETEIKDHLVAKVKEKGLVNGNRFIGVDDIVGGLFDSNNTNYYKNDGKLGTRFDYYPETDTLVTRGYGVYILYQNNKWFEKIDNFPIINGYEGKLSDDKKTLCYGCAQFDVNYLTLMNKAFDEFQKSSNRSVHSITLNSGVVISIEDFNKIIKAL